MKKFASHSVSFLAGLGLGLLIAAKACPPAPAPVDVVPPKEEIAAPAEAPKAEPVAEAPKAEVKVEEVKGVLITHEADKGAAK
jgi:hypothetical protein